MNMLRRSLPVAVAVLLLARPVQGQASFGAHIANANDAFGGSMGVGLRGQAGLPLFPLSLAINGEYFFTDCANDDCGLYGATIDVNYSLAIPVLQPYVGIGWSIRKLENEGRESTERGLNVGAGVQLQFRRLRPFVDIRYEFADAPEKQYIVRVGSMFR